MKGVLDIRRPEVEVVVGPVVQRGDVCEAREGGRRGRARVAARVAVRGQEEPRLWESRAGDDLVDALVDGDREFSKRPKRRQRRGRLWFLWFLKGTFSSWTFVGGLNFAL